MQRFTYGKTLIIGFGFFGISAVWTVFDQFVPILLQQDAPQGFGLTPALALFIMTWDNLINVFVQPWVGARSDRTWNRFGRRKPWILLGMPIAALGFVLIPQSRLFTQATWGIALFIFITNSGMALFRSPTIAWLGDLFPPDDRSKANGIINLMGGVGGLLAFVGGGLLYDQVGPEAPFAAGAALMVVACLVAVWRVREPAHIVREEETGGRVWDNLLAILANPDRSGVWVLAGILFWFMGYQALSTGLSSFGAFTLGIDPGRVSILAATATLTFIVFALPAGVLGTRYGRQPVIRVGLVGLTVLFLAGFFFIQDQITFVAALFLVGLFWALVNVNSLPLVYDHGDETQIGAYTGLYYFSSQSAAVLGPVLAGLVVDSLDDNFRWLFIFGGVFMGLALLVMGRVRQAAPLV